MRVVVSKNEHAIDMTYELINAISGHALGISTAKVDAVLACEVSTAGFVEDSIIIDLSIIRLKQIVGGGICLRERNASGAGGIFVLLRGEHVGKRIVSSGECTSGTGLVIVGLLGISGGKRVIG